MRFVMFYHSLVSDWNHGNAHFLRGVATELKARGHQVDIFEPANGWSYQNLIQEHGETPLLEFSEYYSGLRRMPYDPDSFDLDEVLKGADVVIMHEWNPAQMIERTGLHRKNGGRYQLLFHDTHHRSVSNLDSLPVIHLRHYDGVLAFGESLRRRYLENGWAKQVWTWHEAADLRVFHPLFDADRAGDLVWIGNWGDGERTAELNEFLLEPVRKLGLRARIHGVRYPAFALTELARSGVEYAGWLPNFRVPKVFGNYPLTVHVPRGPYRKELPGIPTIRVFEALACGIPLISAPWDDCEGLFQPGKDFLVAQDGTEMTALIRQLLDDPQLRSELSSHGLQTIQNRHTCAHRTDQLMEILKA